LGYGMIVDTARRIIRGSLHCAPDDSAVRRFGRDDVLFFGPEEVNFGAGLAGAGREDGAPGELKAWMGVAEAGPLRG
jgi:hypothetical protein